MSKFALMAFVFAFITVFSISVLMQDRLCLIVISHGNTVVQTTFSYEE
ncbi:Hok/Gef family protein [Providencia rettgeri]|nr:MULTISPECIES: Hok/Gef family protein [Providencia]MBG5922061.1 Hok/Gef family protein [Providencia rettgeri]HEM8210754.1 Hok/Gef family protein [Providencia rettgeri]